MYLDKIYLYLFVGPMILFMFNTIWFMVREHKDPKGGHLAILIPSCIHIAMSLIMGQFMILMTYINFQLFIFAVLPFVVCLLSLHIKVKQLYDSKHHRAMDIMTLAYCFYQVFSMMAWYLIFKLPL